MIVTLEEIEALNEMFLDKSIEDLLQYFFNLYKAEISVASSLGMEDQVLTDISLKCDPKASVFILDTGRLHQETYTVMTETMEKYKMRFQVYMPEQESLEAMVQEKGPNSFYRSINNRKQCCHIRKVVPLKRALKNKKVWVTGLRRAQSMARANIKLIEWDPVHDMIKLNPLAAWNKKEVLAYIKTHDVPYNKLHDQGFPSIGCAPCTRAIKAGEANRMGRWWWETESEHKECGLHIKTNT